MKLTHCDNCEEVLDPLMPLSQRLKISFFDGETRVAYQLDLCLLCEKDLIPRIWAVVEKRRKGRSERLKASQS